MPEGGRHKSKAAGQHSDRYHQALDMARKEYEKLLADREALETRLARLEQTIGSLGALCHEEATQPTAGLTDAIRSVLRASVQALTPAEVRAQLGAAGFPIADYSNALASIHTVLKRLVRGGEARAYEGPPGTTQYWWWHKHHTTMVLTRSRLPAAIEQTLKLKTTQRRDRS